MKTDTFTVRIKDPTLAADVAKEGDAGGFESAGEFTLELIKQRHEMLPHAAAAEADYIAKIISGAGGAAVTRQHIYAAALRVCCQHVSATDLLQDNPKPRSAKQTNRFRAWMPELTCGIALVAVLFAGIAAFKTPTTKEPLVTEIRDLKSEVHDLKLAQTEERAKADERLFRVEGAVIRVVEKVQPVAPKKAP